MSDEPKHGSAAPAAAPDEELEPASARAKPLPRRLPFASPSAGEAKGLIPARMINEALYCERLLYLEYVQGQWADDFFTARPDWVCEILSESNAATDQVDKFRIYAASGVPFYCIGDPTRRILTVYRLDESGYGVALQAKHGEVVHAPPFDAVPLRVGLLFGEDPD